jgi:predicted nucleic acid-binding protein
MIIVDTTVWVDYFNGVNNSETEWLDRSLGHEAIGLTDLILCEVLQGLCADEQFRAVSAQLIAFDIFSAGGIEFALQAASNFRELRRRGFTVRKTIDCWVATFCIREGHSLLHRDRDYDVFEQQLGLQVIHP